jgi:hypothetical protein
MLYVDFVPYSRLVARFLVMEDVFISELHILN